MLGKKKDALSIFLPEPKEITTVHGETLTIPKVTWAKEIQILRIVGKLVQTLNLKPGVHWMELLPHILEKAPTELTRIAAILLEKDPAWVEQNLEAEQVFEVVIPFCMNLLNKAGKPLPGDLVQKMGVQT